MQGVSFFPSVFLFTYSVSRHHLSPVSFLELIYRTRL